MDVINSNQIKKLIFNQRLSRYCRADWLRSLLCVVSEVSDIMKLSPKRPRSLLLLQEVALIFFASDNIIDIVMQEMSC